MKAKTLFNDTVQEALIDGIELSQSYNITINFVDSEFLKVLQKANQASSGFDELKDRANDVALYRAYVIPLSKIYFVSKSLLDEMKDWGVPTEVLRRLEALLPNCPDENNEKKVRHGFYELLVEHKYWDEYVDWYYEELDFYNGLLFLIALIYVVLSFIIPVYFNDMMFYSFISAGISGAATSIILKTYHLNIYGRFITYKIRIIPRLISGVIASAICYGLLATNVINIGIADKLGNQLITHRDKAILIAIGILAGFSERALYSFNSFFESSIIGFKNKERRKDKKEDK